jgi:hypothetical protein
VPLPAAATADPSATGLLVAVLDLVIVTETWQEPAPGLIFVLVLPAAVIMALVAVVVAPVRPGTVIPGLVMHRLVSGRQWPEAILRRLAVLTR